MTNTIDKKPKCKQYLLTIRKHQVKHYITQHDLDSVVDYLKWKHDSLYVYKTAYEIEDKYKQLHMHAIVSLSHIICYRDNNKYGDYKIHWSPINSYYGAMKYITKDSFNKYEQQQILETNYFNHNYGFI